MRNYVLYSIMFLYLFYIFFVSFLYLFYMFHSKIENNGFDGSPYKNMEELYSIHLFTPTRLMSTLFQSEDASGPFWRIEVNSS